MLEDDAERAQQGSAASHALLILPGLSATTMDEKAFARWLLTKRKPSQPILNAVYLFVWLVKHVLPEV
jgi:hypothetical protein